MNPTIASKELISKLRTSGTIVIVCSVLSLLLGIGLIIFGIALQSAANTFNASSNGDGWILLGIGIFILLVAIFDLIAGIVIRKNSKNIMGWSIYLICAGVFGGLLGYAMLGVGVYVLIQIHDKSNYIEQEVVTSS